MSWLWRMVTASPTPAERATTSGSATVRTLADVSTPNMATSSNGRARQAVAESSVSGTVTATTPQPLVTATPTATNRVSFGAASGAASNGSAAADNRTSITAVAGSLLANVSGRSAGDRYRRAHTGARVTYVRPTPLTNAELTRRDAELARFLQSWDDRRDDDEFALTPSRRPNGFDSAPFRHTDVDGAT